MTYNTALKSRGKPGLTLVEILVAIAILAIVLLFVSRIYFSISDSQKSLSSESLIQSDIEYFTKLISNNIKFAQKGDGILCSIPEGKFFDLNATSSSIAFIKDDECLEFYLVDDGGLGRIKLYDSVSATDQFITSSNTNVLGLVFDVEDNTETGQPLVTILLKASPAASSENFVYIQNTVSVLENVVEVPKYVWTCGDDVFDDECNAYGTVEIGTQCWMTKNLNIGTRIDGVNSQSNNGVIEKYCFNNLESNCGIYGGLYQWNEAMQYITSEPNKGICPTGWHIPSDAEWTILTDYLGGLLVAGGKMKEAGTSHWVSPNAGADNTSGFTALPAGYRNSDGNFWSLTSGAYLWSSSMSVSTRSWNRRLNFNDAEVSLNTYYHPLGFSVRCLKD